MSMADEGKGVMDIYLRDVWVRDDNLCCAVRFRIRLECL
jgi:hypothetical protein